MNQIAGIAIFDVGLTGVPAAPQQVAVATRSHQG